jgi:hypothetical protein
MTAVKSSGAINTTCPVSGKPIHEDIVLTYDGHKIGFCSREHRDQFQTTLENIADAVAERKKSGI